MINPCLTQSYGKVEYCYFFSYKIFNLKNCLVYTFLITVRHFLFSHLELHHHCCHIYLQLASLRHERCFEVLQEICIPKKQSELLIIVIKYSIKIVKQIIVTNKNYA